MECIDLMNHVIKILGIYFPCNKTLEQEKNLFNHIVKIQNILKLWKLRNLSIEGRIIVFKSWAISKWTHLTLVTGIPSAINYLIQMEFIWKGKTPHIKINTLCNDYDNGGLKNVDVFSKIVSLQCSWIKRLSDNNFHQWKVIPLYLIRRYLGRNFKFHSNLEVSHSFWSTFPRFYKEVIIRWGKHLSFPSTVACEFIWHNNHIQIDNKNTYFYSFSKSNLNFVGHFLILMGNWNCGIALNVSFLLKTTCSFNTCKLYMLYHNTEKNLKIFFSEI